MLFGFLLLSLSKRIPIRPESVSTTRGGGVPCILRSVRVTMFYVTHKTHASIIGAIIINIIMLSRANYYGALVVKKTLIAQYNVCGTEFCVP